MKQKFNADRTLAISAIFISLMSLILLLYQTSEDSKQNRLSVRPRLSFNENQNTKERSTSFSLKVRNKGLGPAIVDKAAIIYGGQSYELHFSNLLETVVPSFDTLFAKKETTSIDEGTTIVANEEVTLFEFTIAQEDLPEYYRQLDSLGLLEFDVLVEYASMYGERWRINLQSENSYPEEL